MENFIRQFTCNNKTVGECDYCKKSNIIINEFILSIVHNGVSNQHYFLLCNNCKEIDIENMINDFGIDLKDFNKDKDEDKE